MKIRKEQPKDIKAIHQLNVRAFGGEAEAVLVDRLRAARVLTLSLVAVEGTRSSGTSPSAR